MKTKISLILIGIFLILICASSRIWQIRDYVFLLSYDLLQGNSAIESKEEIDNILASFKQVGTKDLDQEFRTVSKIEASKYSNLLGQSTYYQVPQKSVYQKIAGNTRIRDLISKDQFYRQALFDRTKTLNWLIDKRILYKILELRAALTQNGYKKDGFCISFGHRTPQFNEEVNGASKSRHIKGEAVDMVIHDIDGGGHYTAEDKAIILQLLEDNIIRNEGGIGKYPGTSTVHMDVRGHRARWDSY